MALRLLGSKTVERPITDTDWLRVGPFTKQREVRVMADCLIFAVVSADNNIEMLETPKRTGYPISDLAYEDISIPGGHYLFILGSEPGIVWLTEFANG